MAKDSGCALQTRRGLSSVKGLVLVGKLEQPPKTQVEATKRDGRFTFSAPEKTSYLFTLSGEKQNSINILLKL